MDKNKFEYIIFGFFEKLFSLLGFKKAYTSGKIIGLVFFYLLPIRKKVAVGNLSKAFPELNKNEIKKLARRNYISIGRTFAEILTFKSLSASELISMVEFENSEIIEKYRETPNGLVFLTAHFGNWELGAHAVNLYFGKKISVLVKPQRNEFVTEWLASMRGQFGNKEIPLGASVRELFSALKSGGPIGIVGDQRGSREGTRIVFFGRPTSIYTGAAAIASKLKSPIITVFIIRSGKNRFRLVADELNYSDFEGGAEEITRQITQEYMSRLEKIVSLYPDQLFWMHNIWKY